METTSAILNLLQSTYIQYCLFHFQAKHKYFSLQGENTMRDRTTSYILTSIFLNRKRDFSSLQTISSFLDSLSAATCPAHLPLHPPLFALVHAVDHAAGDEGDGHEEDDDGAHSWRPNSHTETVDLERRQSWRSNRKNRDLFIKQVANCDIQH